MLKEVIESFVSISIRLRNQQKLVRKIEMIIRCQDRDLLSEQQHLIRLRRLQDERRNLALIKAELYAVVDTLTMPQ